ncbi:MAG: hypothetical protein OXC84_12370 [Gammaproteobacteria bacterium]|nr:hypothetical protein [Gammaproteobacteria bacterium]
MPGKTSNNFMRILRAAWTLLIAMVRFLARIVDLLAEGAKAPDTNDATDHAVRGGVLNYRTGKLRDALTQNPPDDLIILQNDREIAAC